MLRACSPRPPGSKSSPWKKNSMTRERRTLRKIGQSWAALSRKLSYASEKLPKAAGAVPTTASTCSLCPAAISEMNAPKDCPVSTTRR